MTTTINPLAFVDYNRTNLILATDSYKLTQDPFFPEETEADYRYFEARVGAEYPEQVWFGLQAKIKQYLVGQVVTQDDIEEAAIELAWHFGDESVFQRDRWQYIVDNYDGRLPIRIRSVKEGSIIPVGNVLFTMENTGDENTRWLLRYLPGHFEPLLTHTWQSATVATKAYHIKNILLKYGEVCGFTAIDYHLHDFGLRGASSLESAAAGSGGHQLFFKGTDTLPGIRFLRRFYNAKGPVSHSVPASEHSNETAKGPEGEKDYFIRGIKKYPNGILSMVSDGYSIIHVVQVIIPELKEMILERWRNGTAFINRFVVRPDSPRFKGDTPWAQVIWLHEELAKTFGYSVTEANGRQFKVLHDSVGVIYGDGLSTAEIEEIYAKLVEHGWSISNAVVGQGGGLLQKINRDTQRFALKSSAQMRGGVWHDVIKNPLDQTKKSKAGRLKLIKNYSVAEDGLEPTWKYETINQHHPLFNDFPDELEDVFLDGELLRDQTYEEIVKIANTY